VNGKGAGVNAHGAFAILLKLKIIISIIILSFGKG